MWIQMDPHSFGSVDPDPHYEFPNTDQTGSTNLERSDTVTNKNLN